MTKYRVIKEYGLYYPQQTFMYFWWKSTTSPASSYGTLEEALEDIERHRRVFSKKPLELVWESEC